MVRLENNNRNIEVAPETFAFRAGEQQSGEIVTNRHFMGSRSHLTRFEVGATVLLSLNEASTTHGVPCDWEVFTVADNPHFQQEKEISHAVRSVSFDEFNVRRHGEAE